MRRTFQIFYLFIFIICASSVAVRAEVTMDQVKDEIQKELDTLPKPSANASVFNPAMGLVLDAVARTHHRGRRANLIFDRRN